MWVASVLCWEFLALLSQKTRLVECGVFRMGDPVSVTITVHLRFISKLIDPSSSVSNLQNFIRLNISSNFVNGDICDSFCFA